MSFQGNSIFWVEVDKIVPNPYQPRREFNEQSLKELSESIRMYGILQPLTVSRKEIERDDGTFYTQYELIAGERRLRASKLAGIEQVPVIIREGEDSEQEKLELAIIENLQREDLNAVDRALAFKQLAEMFGLSHSQVAAKVGRSREYVSNSIRLLGLPEHILNAVRQGDINEGHGRTLLMLVDRPEEQDTVFREIMLKKLSVREVERIARKIATDKVRKKDWLDSDPELIEIERQFTETLGTRVQIQKTDFGGKLTIDYFSPDDLKVMLDRLTVLEAEKASLNQSNEEIEALTHHTGLDFAEQEPPIVAEPEKAQIANHAKPLVDPKPNIAEVETETEVDTETKPEATHDQPTVQEVMTDSIPADQSETVQEPTIEPPSVTQNKIEEPFEQFPRIDNSGRLLEEREDLPEEQTPAKTFDSVTGYRDEVQRQTLEVTEPTTSKTSTPVSNEEPKKPDEDEDLYSIRNFTV